jgi:septum formation protein
LIILASTSPRRIEIINCLGFSFKAISPLFDESSHRIINPLHIPVEFAYKKAISVKKDYPNDLVMGFDTIVFHRGKVLGKPKSMNEAVEFLERMSGTMHEVITGVSIICITNNITCNFTDISHVKFKILTRNTILKYFEKVNPLDKAGAYAIQEYGDMIIGKIEGSMNNIIGLPTEKVLEALSNIEKIISSRQT